MTKIKYTFELTGSFHSSFLIFHFNYVSQNKPHHYPILAGITAT